MKHAVLTALGSKGDLHPMMGLGSEFISRGYKVTVATSACFGEYIMQAGFNFEEIPPDLDPRNTELIKTVLEPFKGPEKLHKKFIFPYIEQSLNAFLPLAEKADVILSGIVAYFAPVAAELTGKSWVSCIYSPLSFWSAYDPPVLAPFPFLGRMRFLGSNFHRLSLKAMLKVSESWAQPVKDLRLKWGLSEGENPFVKGLHSEKLILALFSKEFAQSQPDWPEQTLQTGFVFYDGSGQNGYELSPELKSFLKQGEPPVVFTLGSTSVLQPGGLFDSFIETAERLGSRAVVLVGDKYIDTYRSKQTDKIFIGDYALYSKLFPESACIVHQGGVGTTGQAMLSGKPMLVLPAATDQFDNAEKIKRAGLGQILPVKKYSINRASDLITKILRPEFSSKSAKIRTRMLGEHGASNAVDAIEKVFFNK